MEPNVAEIIAVLKRTPATVRALLDGLPEAWLGTREREATFSPRDVVGHLIHGELTDWMPRVERILESGEARTFEPFDRHGYQPPPGASVKDLLDEFEALRTKSVASLRGLDLTPNQLALKGTHPAFGPVTLGQLLATWLVHDLNHIDQIVRVMSKRYDQTVGPWKEYLGILNR
ncbi:MAG: DinB family protein [Vicinamibacteria bacterium]